MRVVVAIVALCVMSAIVAEAKQGVRKFARGDRCDGVCADIKTPCATRYVPGFCPGKKNIQCCVKSSTPHPQPQTPAQPTPSAPSDKKTFHTASFKAFMDAYPHGEADEAKERIGGKVNAAWITNTCTIRVSRSMNYAGLTVPKNFPLPRLGAGSVLNTVLGADGKNYAYRVREMNEYLRLVYGKPTLEITNGRCDGDKEKSMGLDVPAEWHNKNGLIRFDVRVWSDASGHLDVWYGTGPAHEGGKDKKCVHECYWTKACAAQLWEMPVFESDRGGH